MKTIYIIVSITAEGDDDLTSISIEPVGVYSSYKKANRYIEELEKYTANMSGRDAETLYDILEFKVDDEPPLLGFLKKEKQTLLESIEDALVGLMKEGLVDQLIGEDGHFYYTLTDLGKKSKKTIPENIKKFFGKKK